MATNASRQRTEGRAGRAAPAGAGGGANGTAHAAQPIMDLEFLRGLIEAVDQSGIDTLEINRAGTRIRIAKTPTSAPGGGQLVSAPALTLPMAAGVAAAAEPPPAPAPSNLVDIKSPMVGTFYRAPAPEAPAYVEIGSQVAKGQTLCVLEAMKLMNELEAEVDGVVREVLVDNADPVEYGQVLFRIEPTSR